MLVELFMPFCESFAKENEELKAKIKQLEDQLATNSSNSSKPPSKDNFKSPKARSLRKKSGKKPGGQFGHKGQNAGLRDDPDEVIFYGVQHCPDCDQDLQKVRVDEIIRRQVEDLPPIQSIITEHQIELKTCPCCEQQWQGGGCPSDIKYEFQYGPRIKAISVYLSAYQFIPALRTKQLLEVFGVKLSTGSLDNFRKSASRELKGFMEQLRLSIILSCAGFFDETGIKVRGVGHWIHVAATRFFSFFLLHPKRGRQAHQEMNILSFFKGVLHRDDYHSYHDYPEATHSLCCAHFLRDLIYAIDRNEQQQWADPLIKLLVRIKEHAERSPTQIVDPRWQGRYRKEYRRLLGLGLQNNPPALKQNGATRGRTAQTKTVNLLLRLRDKEEQVLRFMTHKDAHFDNNQAERDLRMNKVRQKISGGFRSPQAGKEFMDVRSFIATVIKQDGDPLQALVELFTPDNDEYLTFARLPE